MVKLKMQFGVVCAWLGLGRGSNWALEGMVV